MLSRAYVCRNCIAKGLSSTGPGRPLAKFSRDFSCATRPSNWDRSLQYGRSLTNYSPVANKFSISARSQYLSKRIQTRNASTSTSSITEIPPTASNAASSSDLLGNATNTIQNAVSAGGAQADWYSGYLRDLGLNFGWGPSSVMQWVVEHMYMYSGLGLGATIVASTLLVRVCLIPFAAKASDQQAKMKAVQYLTDPLREKMKVGMAVGDQGAVQAARSELAAINKTIGISTLKSLGPLLQLPLGFGMWRVVRNMAEAGIPELKTAGYFWFTDLSVADPYYALPILMAVMQHYVYRLMTAQQVDTNTPNFMRSPAITFTFKWALPSAYILFLGSAPAAIHLVFCTATIWQVAQTRALQNAAVRRALNLTPLNLQPLDAASKYTGTMTVDARVKGTAAGVAEEPTPKKTRFSLDAINPIKRMKGTEYFKNTSEKQKKQQRERRSKEYEQQRRKEIEQQKQDFVASKKRTPF